MHGVALFLENPDGMLKLRPFMRPHLSHLSLISYCMYGTLWMKRTCVWHWGDTWAPLPACTMHCASCDQNFAATGVRQHRQTIAQAQSYSRQDKCKTPYLLTMACLSAAAVRGLHLPWDLDLMCGRNYCTRQARSVELRCCPESLPC